jgi:hypothetical protein
MFILIYGERLGNPDMGEPYIAERGVFTSYEEFAPYRAAGWSGTSRANSITDALLARARNEMDEVARDGAWNHEELGNGVGDGQEPVG